MKVTEEEIKERLDLARQAPGLAHLYSFGLILRPGQKGPVCELCGGKEAPIINGRHLNPERWCRKAKGERNETQTP